MICHKHKCIFVHIRKNAGISIISGFDAEIENPDDLTFWSNGVLDRQSDRSEYPDYLVFAIARNPWSRFISGWKWLCKAPRNRRGNLGPEYYRRTPLRTILKDLPKELHENSHDRRHLFWSHMDMLVDSDGRFVADKILRYENLEKDFKGLCRQIGKQHTRLPHRNKVKGRPYWEYYDNETRDMVGEIFHNDIEYFGYKFGDPDSAPAKASVLKAGWWKSLVRRNRTSSDLPGR